VGFRGHGSEGFESKKLGGPPSGGAASNRLTPGEFSGMAERKSGDRCFFPVSATPPPALVEISGVIKWFDASKG